VPSLRASRISRKSMTRAALSLPGRAARGEFPEKLYKISPIRLTAHFASV